MRRSLRFPLFIVVVILAVLACGPSSIPTPTATLDPNYLGYLRSLTQTAQVEIFATDAAQPMNGEDSEGFDRCSIFSNLELSLIYYPIIPDQNNLTLYFLFPEGVPGYTQEIEDDPNPWEYTAQIANLESDFCRVEESHDRLYCYLDLPHSYHNTVQSVALFVNNCEDTIFSLEELSLVVSTPTETPLISQEQSGCGPEPRSSAIGHSCSLLSDYQLWCTCSGGNFICDISIPGHVYGSCINLP